jgi:hypothetical protein
MGLAEHFARYAAEKEAHDGRVSVGSHRDEIRPRLVRDSDNLGRRIAFHDHPPRGRQALPRKLGIGRGQEFLGIQAPFGVLVEPDSSGAICAGSFSASIRTSTT